MTLPAIRHFTLRLALAGLALAAGGAVYFLSRPVFYSRALVRVDGGGGAERVRAVAKELTQPQLLERTASRLGVKVPESELRKSYLFVIAAQSVSAREIEVEVRTHSKEWAEHWVETLVSECRDFRRVRRRKETADAIRALNKEMGDIAEKLGNAGREKFEAVGAPGLQRELAYIGELRDPAREIGPLAARIGKLSRVHADLLNPDISIVEKLSLLSAIERDGPADSAQAWESLEQRRRPLIEFLRLVEFGGIAPDATALALYDDIEELDRKLRVEFDTNFHRFDVEYRNLADQKTALEEKATRPVGPADAAMNLRLRHIAQQIETLGGGEDGGDPIYAGMREIGDRPVSPNILKIALLSLLGGGALAFAVPSFIGRLGSARAKSGQLETRLGLRALGSIPAIPNLPPRTPALADAEDERLAPLAEIFRGIRANLLADGEVPRVLMVTSAMPGEGKTITAANLGIAFAEAGARTLVIDTDMRRGRLHRLFGYRVAPGLGELLAGKASAENAIRPTPHENLYVINAGKAAAPGADLLDSEALTRTIAQLRGSLDVLILDAPPVLGLRAAASLAPRCDATLLVVSPGKKSAQAAVAALEILRARSAKVRGFILNRAPV